MYQNDPDNFFTDIDPLEDIHTTLKQQYMHFFPQLLDIVLTARHSDNKFEDLQKAIHQLTFNYNEMCKAYETWFDKHKHGIDVAQDQNKTANVYTI